MAQPLRKIRQRIAPSVPKGGFSFWAANADDMVYTLRWAVDQYYNNRPGWKGLVKSAMTTDVSWEKSTDVYEELYYTICNWPDN